MATGCDRNPRMPFWPMDAHSGDRLPFYGQRHFRPAACPRNCTARVPSQKVPGPGDACRVAPPHPQSKPGLGSAPVRYLSSRSRLFRVPFLFTGLVDGCNVGSRVLPPMLNSDDVSDPHFCQGEGERALGAFMPEGSQEFEFADRLVGLDITGPAQLLESFLSPLVVAIGSTMSPIPAGARTPPSSRGNYEQRATLRADARRPRMSPLGSDSEW